MLSLPPPVSTNMAMPTLKPSVNWLNTEIKPSFSVWKAVFQFAVLSMKISTFGRSAENAGLARKMSVSSLTGSNTDQPICGRSRSAAAAAARKKVDLVMIGLPCIVALGLRTGPGELPDLDALHHACSGAGKRVGHCDAEFPVVVFGCNGGNCAGPWRRRGKRACPVADRNRETSRRGNRDRRRRRVERRDTVQDLLD